MSVEVSRRRGDTYARTSFSHSRSSLSPGNLSGGGSKARRRRIQVVILVIAVYAILSVSQLSWDGLDGDNTYEDMASTTDLTEASPQMAPWNPWQPLERERELRETGQPALQSKCCRQRGVAGMVQALRRQEVDYLPRQGRALVDTYRVKVVGSKQSPGGEAVPFKLHHVALRYKVCNGLTNQRIALIEGVLLGIFLGVQVLVPDEVPLNGAEYPGNREMDRNFQDASTLFDLESFVLEAEEIFLDHWCRKNPARSAAHFWCGEGSPKPILYGKGLSQNIASTFSQASAAGVPNGGIQVIPIEDLHLPGKPYPLNGLNDLERELSSRLHQIPVRERGYTVIDASCTLFSIAVREHTPAWQMFWRLSSALQFSAPITARANTLTNLIRSQAEAARAKAARFGFDAPSVTEERQAGFNVLHLRAEEDWQEHCKIWMTLPDGVHRDNCINNTMTVANVLLSEGVKPSVPLYISTGLTRKELENLQIQDEIRDEPNEVGRAFQTLFEVYTVICKDDVLELSADWTGAERETHAAIDYLISQQANCFVGNSVSTFSAYIILDKHRRGECAFHYNGGNVPIASAGFLKPAGSLSVPTLGTPLKWVFAIHVNENSRLSSSFSNMMKVAVRSAAQKTDMIPICLTTLKPADPLAVWLVQNGVRVLYHSPTWTADVKEIVDHQSRLAESLGQKDSREARSHLLSDPDAMIGTFLRIDIPIMGILDEFVLYTDVDLLFSGSVTWQELLGDRYSNIRKAADFSRGLFYSDEPGTQGLPLYFSASSEMEKQTDPAFLNAGVMLLNMRSLRETYSDFTKFILADPDLEWPSGPGDQGAYKTFYSTETGDPHANFLPFELNWKSYWEKNPLASIVHFHGPKCEKHIIPYRAMGTVTVDVFRGILEKCAITGDCYARCDEFMDYLEGPNRDPVDSLIELLHKLDAGRHVESA